MFSPVWNIVMYAVLLIAAIILLLTTYTKKKPKIILAGFLICFFSAFGLIFEGVKYYDQEQKAESQNRLAKLKEKNLMESLNEQINKQTPLQKDTTIIFDGSIKLLIPENFVFAMNKETDLKLLLLLNKGGFGNFWSIIRKIYTPKVENLKIIIDQLNDRFQKSGITYVLSDDNVLDPVNYQTAIRKYTANQNNKMIHEGTMVYAKSGNYFYNFQFSTAGISPETNEDIIKKIYHSIEFIDL